MSSPPGTAGQPISSLQSCGAEPAALATPQECRQHTACIAGNKKPHMSRSRGGLRRSSDELYHHEKYDCADECGEDRSHQSAAKGHTYSWQEVARDNRAEHTNDNVAQQDEPDALDDYPGQPTGDCSDDK